ncbi:Outer membrane protein assembly factor BamB [Rhodovastum atsumiense]|nr:PQQ-binding-like beta-propeller repeat protein [Rhodovastum atsumiense]CAH2601536.1 Outer membrane protein assembly factor BamB [Rhodovastum atsumiense]
MADRPTGAARLPRRAALLMSVGLLGGCSMFDDLFSDTKPKLPGERISVMNPRRGLEIDPRAGQVTLPPPLANADWPQAGGTPAHAMGHLQAGERLATAWRAGIGEGGGYRRKITAQPVIAAGRVFTMDSDAVVTAYDAGSGRQLWRLETQPAEDRSTNIGGGIGVDGDTLYAGTGRAEVLAIEAATGKIRWRKPTDRPVRSAPTIAEGRLFVAIMNDELLALATDDGRKLWSYQARTPETSVLGLPAPAYADGVVVAGFGSGELVGLRATSGTVAWSDSLASARGRNSMLDLSAIRGLPALADGRVYAGSLGGLTISLDPRTGRRLWERDVATGDTLWVAGEWLFLLGTEGQLAAISRSEGRVAWVTQLPRFEDEKKQEDPIRWIGPVLAGGRLLLGGSDGTLAMINPITGEVLGRQELPGPLSVSPAVAGGMVYLVTQDATLVALR